MRSIIKMKYKFIKYESLKNWSNYWNNYRYEWTWALFVMYEKSY